MTKALGWLQAGKICNSEGVTVVELNAGHKRGILRKVFEDPSIPREKKMAMMEEVMGDEKSDLAENARLTCMACLPDAEGKAETWAAITDPNSGDSMKESIAKMSGFYSRKQMDLVRPYFDMFYQVLPVLQKATGQKYMNAFVGSLLPTFEIDDSQIVQLVTLKNDTPDNEGPFANMLQDAIERLIKYKLTRNYAREQASHAKKND